MARRWTELIIGVVLLISPWALGFSDISLAKWCNILLGIILILMNSWKLFGSHPASQTAQQSKPSPKK